MQIVLFLIMRSLSGMRAFDSRVPLLPKQSLRQRQQACESGQEGARNVLKENCVKIFRWFYWLIKLEPMGCDPTACSNEVFCPG